MTRALLTVPGAAVVAAVFLTSGPAATHADSFSAQDQRTVVVTVLDRRGAPVPGMTAADFRVRENGRNMTIVSAQPAKTPLTIALMLDDSGLGLQSMREGAAAFISRLSGHASIALYTTGGRTLKRQNFTESTATLMGVLNKVYARNLTGSFFVDGIVSATEEFAKAEAARTAIVSVAVEGEDFSQTRPPQVLDALQKTGTRLYVIRLGTPTIGQGNAYEDERGESLLDEHVRLNAFLGQAQARTGGRVEQLSSHTGILPMMENFAIELTSQYEVTYTGANLAASDVRFEVSTSKRDVRVRAPQRIGAPR